MAKLIRSVPYFAKCSSTPWSYRKGSSLLHRMPAGAKLVFLLLLSLASFLPGTAIQSFIVLGGIFLILIALSLIAGIAPPGLLRGSGPLLFIVLGVFLFQAAEFSPPGINLQGLGETIIFCARITAAFSAGTLLFAVTTPSEIRKSLSRAESFLRREKPGVTKPALSLYISLMLGFLPRFFVIWEDLNLAWKSRGGKKKLSRLITLIPPAIEKMMSGAADTAKAMEARGAV